MSSSIESERPYHHGNLRQALLDAAFGLLATRPAAQLSLREVARAAGVSHAAPYHYFADRDALLKAVGTECMRRFLHAQQAAVEHESAPVQRLLALGLAYVGFAHAQPNAFALVFDAQLCPPGAPNAESAPLIAANEALLRDCVAAMQQADDLPDVDGDALGAALWGTVHGLAQLVMAGHLPMQAVEPALRALLAPHAPGRG
ncbi:MAG: TetR/AcrR family transcriptional regulator [Ottowia sp.]|uniref:TetR/AcrR family transcriptional regulator n=1 Tax=Ottowia sp. TaxID=1898956 RepID=UPI0039E46184